LNLHANPFHLDPVDDEPSNGKDEFHPLDCPPGFSPDLTPTDDQPFEPLHPSGQTPIGRTMLFNWPVVGWCLGNITERNLNARLKVGGRVANFKVFYPCNSTTATHALHLDSYDHHHNSFRPSLHLGLPDHCTPPTLILPPPPTSVTCPHCRFPAARLPNKAHQRSKKITCPPTTIACAVSLPTRSKLQRVPGWPRSCSLSPGCRLCSSVCFCSGTLISLCT